MSHFLWKTLVLSPVVLGVTVLCSARAMATKTLDSAGDKKPEVALENVPIASQASVFSPIQPKTHQQLLAQTNTDENNVF